MDKENQFTPHEEIRRKLEDFAEKREVEDARIFAEMKREVEDARILSRQHEEDIHQIMMFGRTIAEWNRPKKKELTSDSICLINRLKSFWKVIQELPSPTPVQLHRENTLNTFQEKGKFASENPGTGIASPLAPMMKVLPHLHFPEGTLLDYYQCGDDFGSQPEFYVRKENEQRLPDNSYRCNPDGVKTKIWNIFDVVTPEFTPEGIWELLLLDELGSQFGLYWHANYRKKTIIYDMDEFFSGKQCGNMSPIFFNAQSASDLDVEKLYSWDITPKVELNSDKAFAEYCIFSPFSGFFKVKCEIQFTPNLRRLKPVILEHEPYHCGIRF